MTRPAVSILMPVYNSLPYLGDAIASILAQEEDDWELIALDDGSSDGSAEFLSRLRHPRIQVVHSRKNRGVSAALNRGIEMARGRYIARMDSDDLSTPDRLRKQLSAMQANPSLDLLSSSFYVVDQSLRVVRINRQPCDHGRIVKHAVIDVPLSFGSLLGKTEWWAKWRLDERIPWAGHEYDLYLRSHRQSCFANLPDLAYVYRFRRSWRKMTVSVYCKCQSLVWNGFSMGMPVQTMVGLASMLPRPLLYAAKIALGHDSALARHRECPPTGEQLCEFDTLVRRIRSIEVPLLCS